MGRRPAQLLKGSRDLRWFEQHYPFGETIDEGTPDGDMTAGSGDYETSWKPGFRFPGQYQDSDTGLAGAGASLFVQNHYREYMPRFGRYNRVDPVSSHLKYSKYTGNSYTYVFSSPFKFDDVHGLWPLLMGECGLHKSWIYLEQQ